MSSLPFFNKPIKNDLERRMYGTIQPVHWAMEDFYFIYEDLASSISAVEQCMLSKDFYGL